MASGSGDVTNSAEELMPPPAKKPLLASASSDVYDPIRPGYKVTTKLAVKFDLSVLAESEARASGSNLLVANHLDWHVYVRRKPVKTRQNANEDFLCAFIHCANSGLYPFANQTRFTLLALEAANNVTNDGKPDQTDKNGAALLSMEKLTTDKHKFERDGQMTVIATVTLSLPTCYNFKSTTILADVNVKIGETIIPLTKSSLALHSPVFYAMFFGSFTEGDKSEVVLQEVEKEDFVFLLNVLYVRSFDFNAKIVPGVLALADRFGMTAVIEQCETVLLSDMAEHVVPLAQSYALATRYNLKTLENRCLAECSTVTVINQLAESPHYSTLTAEAKLKLFDRMRQVTVNCHCGEEEEEVEVLEESDQSDLSDSD